MESDRKNYTQTGNGGFYGKFTRLTANGHVAWPCCAHEPGCID